ncbi:MAG: NADH-quinone oxidoreductase subunit N [Actinomycetota bacterium]|nr:NADH-quinone oxidoreductase subunit N [Actinomycetota bacterium]
MTLLAQLAPIESPSIDWFAIAPPLALFTAALFIVLVRSIYRHNPLIRPLALLMAITGVICAGAFTFVQWLLIDADGPFSSTGPYEASEGMGAVDGFSVFVMTVVLIATLLAILLASGYLGRERLEAPEFYVLMLCSATGMMLMASANDLIIVFLALEILSIALYVLAAFDRRRATSQEAGLKYFLLGSFSSAVFLYGVALVYGATGSTNLTKISQYLATTTILDSGVLVLGIMLLLVGLGFKVGAAPFHMWTPDVYEGAPTPVTAFMAGATKAAAFGAILRVFFGAFDLYRTDWRPAVWALAVLSLLVGSIAALVQTDVKRMLAYSSISHAGYILIGVQAANDAGASAALFYLFVYALMVFGSFAVVTVVARGGDENHTLADFRGLSVRQPMLAGLLTLFLLAQAGVPLTGGFVAKLSVFDAALDAGQYPLALLGMLTAAIAAFVYLRIILAMFAPEDGADIVRGKTRVDFGTGVALTLAAAGVLFLGLVPGRVLDFAKEATCRSDEIVAGVVAPDDNDCDVEPESGSPAPEASPDPG